jgi:hypothetical protein
MKDQIIKILESKQCLVEHIEGGSGQIGYCGKAVSEDDFEEVAEEIEELFKNSTVRQVKVIKDQLKVTGEPIGEVKLVNPSVRHSLTDEERQECNRILDEIQANHLKIRQRIRNQPIIEDCCKNEWHLEDIAVRGKCESCGEAKKN